ncbi:MAG: FAD-dependent oxidoreductase [Candidatus Odinarchaeia archaeon]
MKDKVGIYLCSCGDTLRKVLNLEELANFSRKLKNVSIVEIHNSLCLEDSLKEFARELEENKLSKVVIGACSPKIKLQRFKNMLKERNMAVNVEFVNLREQCVFPHKNSIKEANIKAKAMIAAAVERVNSNANNTHDSQAIASTVLVIGGGIAGIQAALDVADYGYDVILVEKEENLGGISSILKHTWHQGSGSDLLSSKIKELKNRSNVEIYLKAHIKEINGVPGNYEVKIYKENKNKAILKKVGAIIVATGITEFKPYNIPPYGYGKNDNVITQLELAYLLDKWIAHSQKGELPKRVLMVQCVGSRDPAHHYYCSSLCCNYALKHAKILRQLGVEVVICYKHMRTPYLEEKMYRDAVNEGVLLLRGEVVKVEAEKDKTLNVQILNTFTNEVYQANFDFVVLSSAIEPDKTLSSIPSLELDLRKSGFYDTIYPKVIISKTKHKGIFICGSSYRPMDIPLTLAHASSAALEAITFLRCRKIEPREVIAEVNEEICDGCEACEKICPFHAVKVNPEKEVAEVNSNNCIGCGLCSAVCPTGAIQIKNFEQEVVFNQIEALIKTAKENGMNPVILGFICSECAYCAADQAGLKGLEYPPNILPLTVPCSGRISVLDILKALVTGADGVFIAACPVGSCHYPDGSSKNELMVAFTKEILNKIGVNEKRVKRYTMISAEPDKFAEAAVEFSREISKLTSQVKSS